jgi:hypothetical protein
MDNWIGMTMYARIYKRKFFQQKCQLGRVGRRRLRLQLIITTRSREAMIRSDSILNLPSMFRTGSEYLTSERCHISHLIDRLDRHVRGCHKSGDPPGTRTIDEWPSIWPSACADVRRRLPQPQIVDDDTRRGGWWDRVG